MAGKHSLFGPSCLKRRLQCPRSYWIEKELWDKKEAEEDSEVAAEGQLLHEAVCDKSKRDKLNIEQLIALEKIDNTIAYWMGFKPVKEVYYECKVSTKHPEGLSDYDISGTADLIIIHTDNTAVIIDFKFGRIPVDQAEMNLQVFAYALAAHDTFGVTSVTMQIAQPRVFNGIGEPYSCSDFYAIRENLETIIGDCLNPDAKCEVGKECKYCAGKTYDACEEFRSKQMEVVAVKTEELRPVVTWTDDQIAKWLDKMSRLVEFTENTVKSEAKRRAIEKGNCSGYVATETNGKRKAKDIMDLFGFVDTLGIGDKEFLGLCSVSISNLESEMAKKIAAKAKANGERLTMKDAKDRAKEWLEPYVVSEGGSTKLEKKG